MKTQTHMHFNHMQWTLSFTNITVYKQTGLRTSFVNTFYLDLQTMVQVTNTHNQRGAHAQLQNNSQELPSVLMEGDFPFQVITSLSPPSPITTCVNKWNCY